MLLKEVMDWAAPNKKPHEVFDLIGGTSTGGLIAIMLGRLKMSAQECLDTYDSVMKDVFGSGWLHKHIGKSLDYLTKDKTLLWDESNPCKILLMATREESASNRGTVFLRSYTNDLDPPDVDLANIKLWEAARATSAAPGYFKPIEVGRVKLVDVAQLGLDFKYAMQSFADIATDTENTNILFRALIDAFAPHAQTKKYYRLNVSKELPGPADSKGILDWLTQSKAVQGSEQP
ncbi:hypothetical protein N7471_013591 [Penicillium samsonianum]|uniref:uncharacterized protein n=1 Tax=Penicillium samsonianum TaxID=1882272 RepID=UPI0025494913|nr:uncharacterized protein N7471_013591 [Penicillium samsonianum]KAJ6118971.1 hypothetical protein N7471_013591 [Penicillium samsonianum]